MNPFFGGLIVVSVFLGVYAVCSLVLIAAYTIEISADLKQIRISSGEDVKKPNKPGKDLLWAYVFSTVGAIMICLLAHLAGLI